MYIINKEALFYFTDSKNLIMPGLKESVGWTALYEASDFIIEMPENSILRNRIS